MLARASLIVLALASPAWADPDGYPAGLFERSPLNDTPAAVSHRSQILLRVKLVPMALALRPVSAQTALVTITASGAIRGRNHCARRARLRPPSKRKTCLMSAQTALVTITASGAIRGRNHAKSAPVRSPAGSGRPFRARRHRCLALPCRPSPRPSWGFCGARGRAFVNSGRSCAWKPPGGPQFLQDRGLPQ